MKLPGNVPAAVIVRAEQLCRLLDVAAEGRPDRQVLIAALLATAPADADELANRLKAYRKMTVRETLAGEPEEGDPIDLQRELSRAQTPADPD